MLKRAFTAAFAAVFFYSNVLAGAGRPLSRARSIVILQDVHYNLEAQKNLTLILEEFNQKASDSSSPLLVGVEAAFERFDFPRFRFYDRRKVRQPVADALFESKKISAPGYVGLTAAKLALNMIGVDDARSYAENVEAYRESQRMKPSVSRELEKRLAVLNEEKRRALNPALARFDGFQTRYQAGSLSLADYARYLTRVRGADKPDPAVEQFLEASAIEKSLDFSRVKAKRALQIRYLQYARLAKGIDTEALIKAVRHLETSALRSLTRTTREEELMRASRRWYLAKKLTGFALTPSEWEEYRENEQALAGGESFEAFYRQADGRSRLMAENLLKRLGDSASAVLIAGGFHTPELKRIFKAAGCSVQVIRPRITKMENGSGYLSVFAREKTPLEKLFAGEKLFLGDAAQQLGGHEPTNRFADTLLAAMAAAEQSALPPTVKAKRLAPDLLKLTFSWGSAVVALGAGASFALYKTVGVPLQIGNHLLQIMAPLNGEMSANLTAALLVFGCSALMGVTLVLNEQEKRVAAAFGFIEQWVREIKGDLQKEHIHSILEQASKFMEDTTPLPSNFPALFALYLHLRNNQEGEELFLDWRDGIAAHLSDESVFKNAFKSLHRKIRDAWLDQYETQDTQTIAPEPDSPLQPLNIYSATRPNPYRHPWITQNEDASVSLVMPDGVIFAVTLDGMGGYGHGDQASRLIGAVLQIIMTKFWRKHRARPEEFTDAAIQAAINQALAKALGILQKNPLTINTAAGAVLVGTFSVPIGKGEYRSIIVNAGDARAYLIRPGQPLINASIDGDTHGNLLSLEQVQQRIKEKKPQIRLLQSFSDDSEKIKDPELKNFWNNRNVTTNAISQTSKMVYPAFTAFTALPGDSLLFLTDGVVDPKTRGQISSIVLTKKDPQKGLEDLVQASQPNIPLKIQQQTNPRAKVDDAEAVRIVFGAPVPFPKEGEQEFDRLLDEFEKFGICLVNDELFKAEIILDRIETALNAIPDNQKRHPAFASLFKLERSYREALGILIFKFIPGERLTDSQAKLEGLVLDDGQIYPGVLVLADPDNGSGYKLHVVNRDDVIGEFGGEQKRFNRFQNDKFFQMRNETARDMRSVLALAQAAGISPHRLSGIGEIGELRNIVNILQKLKGLNIVANPNASLAELRDLLNKRTAFDPNRTDAFPVLNQGVAEANLETPVAQDQSELVDKLRGEILKPTIPDTREVKTQS